MIVRVVCASCDGAVVAGPLELSDPELIGTLLLAAHAAPPHVGPHKLEVRIDGAVPAAAPGLKELRVRCLQCQAPELVQQVEHPGLVSAVVVAFHTSHEGHALEIHYDGKRLYP